MFCCKCGARNPRNAVHCNKCGARVIEQETSELHQVQGNSEKVGSLSESRQSRLFHKGSHVAPEPTRCHACGGKDQLYSWQFGMARELSARRAWEDTAVSVAVSAITIPLLGVAGFQMPGKKARLQVLRFRLVLCKACWDKKVTYSAHPQWETARSLGFTQILDANELRALRPVRGKK